MISTKLGSLTAIFLSMFSMSLYAQTEQKENRFKVGVDLGYTNTSLNANISNLVDSKYNSRGGFGINVSAEMNVWNSLFVSTGVSYLQRNYEFERTGSREGWYSKYSNDFISVPLLVGGYLINNPYSTNGVWVKAAGGIYTEYWAKMKTKGQYPVFSELQPDGSFNYTTVSENYDFKKNENQLRRLSMGLQGQVQVGYAIDKIDVYLGYNYLYGLTETYKYDSPGNKKNTRDSHMISIGAAYKF
ncbi:outer membrane beta-barrel protein [Myroides odoratimimus]|uniref:outer membrane beta-barrel protein n=1 Tax=Myroides odoratimimus TaxID=76832 RepID=UPI0025768F1C|nr:outer membrane beta-barrel protein [Myroides odoratimimus]MDM1398641.1 outer membrane beta-barrel protein [Myroides odoratimimus]